MPIEVQAPVTHQTLARLDGQPQIVQFSTALSEPDCRVLGEWFADHPLATLRAYGYGGTDLEFLRWFPRLRRFNCDLRELSSLDGLRHLPEDVDSLTIGATRKQVSLRPLARFATLKRLYLEGHDKDFEVVSSLTTLRDLTLRSITLPDLDPLVPLTELRALDLKLGGTSALGRLPDIGQLEYLELWQIRGLSDLSSVGHLQSLQYLVLQSLRRVEQLPDLANCTRLSQLWFETMKGVQDLTPITTAPHLEHLALVDIGHLQPADLRPLLQAPSLRTVRAGLGSTRKNGESQQLLGDLAASDWDDWSPSTFRYR